MKGSITKTDENRWRLVFDLDRLPNQKRRQKVVRFNGPKKDAEKKLRDIIADYEKDTRVDPSAQTFGEYLVYWLDMTKSSVELGTSERYAQIIRVNIIPLLGCISLQGLDTRQIDEAYIALLDHGRLNGTDGLAPKTIRNIHSVISAALKKAVTWKMIQANPAIDVTLPKKVHAEMVVLTKEQSAELLAACEGRWLHPIIFTAMMTGMRRGEIVALRWANVNLDEKYIRVIEAVEKTKDGIRIKDTKTTNGRRKIPLTPQSVEYLKRHKVAEAEKRLRLGIGWDDDAFVFTTQDCCMRKPNGITKNFGEFVRAIGMNITFHGLRHTHISQLLGDGYPITTVSRRAGHASVSITLDVYGHMMPESQEAMMEEYGAAFEAAMEQVKNKAPTIV
jgi:integrase